MNCYIPQTATAHKIEQALKARFAGFGKIVSLSAWLPKTTLE
jgi:hypothetical protein